MYSHDGTWSFLKLLAVLGFIVLAVAWLQGAIGQDYTLLVIFALVGSMVMSLTLMPVLASIFLPRRLAETDPWPVRLARWLAYGLVRLLVGFSGYGGREYRE